MKDVLVMGNVLPLKARIKELEDENISLQEEITQLRDELREARIDREDYREMAWKYADLCDS